MYSYENVDLITVEEAAERLHVGKGTVYKLLKSDDGLRAFRLGRIWKIPASSVSELIARRSGMPITAAIEN